VIDFCVSTAVTLSLVAGGWGVMAIAVGRVAAQCCALVMQYVLAGERPRIGVDRAVVGPVLRFGLPVAATTLLSWAVLNVDNVVIAKMAGPVELGFYVLAFNIAMWPMSALGQVIRSVALPAFARSRDSGDDDAVVRAVSLVWALALPAGACLAVVATPVIDVLYGDVWSRAAPVLMALGIFGSLRVLYDLLAAFLLAHGRSGLVLWIQVVWCVALVPALVWATAHDGAVGAGWSHVAVGLLAVTPMYAVALRVEGLSLRRVWAGMSRPTLASVPAALVGWWVVNHSAESWQALVLGFASGAIVYGIAVGPWVWKLVTAEPVEVVPAPPHVALQADV
jgi:O-antigen/teichoic acid export membrane protein